MKRTSKTAPRQERRSKFWPIEKQGWLVGDINRYRRRPGCRSQSDYCEPLEFQFVTPSPGSSPERTTRIILGTRKVDELINLRAWKTAR